MNTIGFPKSHLESEKRRFLDLEHIKLMRHPDSLYFEKGYGDVLGIRDEDFRDLGCNVCSFEEVLSKDVICDIKFAKAPYLKDLHTNQILFGWIHANNNKELSAIIKEKKLTAFAWEKLYDEGLYLLSKNNELAGEAAVIHAFVCYGKLPYASHVALIGAGNAARGAMKSLNNFGSQIDQYTRKTEKLLKRDLYKYDAIVNCVNWDLSRTDHIISKKDLKNMKRGSLIIDVSCDKNGAIETSIPNTLDNPTYFVDGIMHYVVSNAPSLFYKTFSSNNAQIMYPLIEQLIEGDYSKILKDAIVAKNGVLLH